MVRPWQRPRLRVLRLPVTAPRWRLFSEVILTSQQLRLARQAVTIAFGALIAQLCGLIALWATASQAIPIQGLLSRAASHIANLLPFLDFQLPAEAPGLKTVIIAVVACWWSTTAALNCGSRILRRIFPLGQRSPSRLMVWLRGPLQSLLWLSAIGLGLALIAEAEGGRLGIFLRWGAALGLFAAGYGAVYRLTPGRWLPESAWLPGALLAGATSLGSLALLAVAGSRLTSATGVAAVATLLLWVALVYGNSLMLLVGGQLNVSLGRRSPMRRSQLMPSRSEPPSFESFTIRRPPR
ncbi:hypothetical protein C7271_10640 [filamentous cyanobacterium CCP5]|nr:hypothetical protein C7271_10640 [filamentous cyanobacterium CCP5]